MGCVAEELSSALERGRGWEGQEVVLQVEGWANAKVCGSEMAWYTLGAGDVPCPWILGQLVGSSQNEVRGLPELAVWTFLVLPLWTSLAGSGTLEGLKQASCVWWASVN
jgi:hypothetical protein